MGLTAGATVDGRYTAVRLLGRGATAEVWLLRHDRLGTTHALKVLAVHSATLRERLLREGRIQASLRHPNVVPVSDVLDVGGAPALLMEHVEGPSLKALLAHQRLTLSQADLLFQGLVKGVAAAHRAGLVHRDLKPANVLLRLVPGGVVPKVTDFGLAKVLAPDEGSLETRTGALLGTPAYMAPEQVRDASTVDHRADLFALGAIAYELVTGVRPFQGEDAADTFSRVREARHAPVADVEPSLPPSIAQAIEACLMVDPDDRVQDCDALLAIWSRDLAELSVSGESLHVSALGLATTDDGARIVPVEVPQTWTDSVSGPTRSTWDEATPAPAVLTAPAPVGRAISPAIVLALFLAGTGFAGGLGALGLVLSRPSPPAFAPPAAAPLAAVPPGVDPTWLDLKPVSDRFTRLSMDMGSYQEDLPWLQDELPRRVVEVEQAAADLERRYPDHEIALQAQYFSGLARFQAWSTLAYLTPPPDATPAQRAAWDEALPALKAEGWRSLDEARARFDALAHADHPAAESTTWPATARNLMTQIDRIPRPD